jgi:hypothetical protein
VRENCIYELAFITFPPGHPPSPYHSVPLLKALFGMAGPRDTALTVSEDPAAPLSVLLKVQLPAFCAREEEMRVRVNRYV